MTADAARPDDEPRGALDPASPFGEPLPPLSARIERARRLAATPDGIPALNRLASLAARLLDTESAQVSVITDEQMVMGGVGAAASSVGQRSPVAESLCTLTVHRAQPLVIADARTADGVRDLPPVVAGVVGSYLGVPLVAGDHVIGALCVFDPTPRDWSEHDVDLLAGLAGPALTELELAALEDGQREDRLLWQLAVDAAGVGAWDWDPAADRLRWDDRLLELFGLERDAVDGTLQSFVDSVHPEDRERTLQALRRSVETAGSYEAEYRVTRADGAVRWVAARGHAVLGPDGSVARVVGAAYDTTAVREGEAKVARTLEVMPSAFFHLDPEWRFTYANPEAQRMLGGIGTDVIGHVVWDLFPAAVGSDFERHYRASMETGRPGAFESYYPPPLDHWYEVRCWPTPDGLSVYFLDVTDRHRMREVLDRAARRAELLADVTRALTDTLEADEAVTRLAQLMVPGLADWSIVTLVEGELPHDLSTDRAWRHRLRDLGWWHGDPALRPTVARYAQLRIPALTDDSLVARALESGKPVVVAADAAEQISHVLEDEAARRVSRRLAPGAVAVVPLPGRRGTAGLMSVFRDEGRETFADEDLELLVDVAERAGLALDNARLYAGQRDLAEALQHSLLTDPPVRDDLDVAVRYQPSAEAAQVGGDWYDAFSQADGTMNLVIGDVVGHDTAAAAAMSQVRGLVRGIAATTGEGPARVLERVDAAISVLQVDTLATALVARLERPAGLAEGSALLRWSNAGHPPPVVASFTAEGEVVTRQLWAGGTDPLLGMGDDVRRHDTDVTVPAGSVLLLYTDGLVERRDQSLADGLQQLEAALGELAAQGLGLGELCDRLLRRMLPARTDDDVALIAVRLGGR